MATNCNDFPENLLTKNTVWAIKTERHRQVVDRQTQVAEREFHHCFFMSYPKHQNVVLVCNHVRHVNKYLHPRTWVVLMDKLWPCLTRARPLALSSCLYKSLARRRDMNRLLEPGRRFVWWELLWSVGKNALCLYNTACNLCEISQQERQLTAWAICWSPYYR